MEPNEFNENCIEQAKSILNRINKVECENPKQEETLKKLFFEGLDLLDRSGGLLNFSIDWSKLENLSINDENINKMKFSLERFINLSDLE